MENLIHRYSEFQTFSTSLDVDQDLVDLIQGFTSHGVVSDILRERHGVTEARRISAAATEISHFVRQGVRFLEQARSGPRVVSFLPYYYAFLQFVKALIVARLGAAATSQMLTHGLSYKPTAKDSHSIDGEEISIWDSGVFRLLYEVLTGKQLPDLRRGSKTSQRLPWVVLSMNKVYPFLMDASFEYSSASSREGARPRFAHIVIERTNKDGKTRYILKIVGNASPILKISPLIRRFGIDGKPLTLSPSASPHDHAPLYLLYHQTVVSIRPFTSPPFWYETPLWNGRLQYPEEIPLFLSFFHLGSVVRYKPRFMERVMDSLYYPFLLATDRHCTTKFCLLFLEDMMRRTYLVQAA